VDKIARLRYDIDQLDKRLQGVINAHNAFVAEQMVFNNGVEKNMQVIYDAFVKPQLDKKAKAEKVIISPYGD